MSTFTTVNESSLCRSIARCRSRLVYIAPGATQLVAEAIGALFRRADAPSVTLIVDVDPEVCRLGYGTAGGLKALQALVDQHQIGIRYQPGLRVGVLIVDGDLLVYSPTPLLIEAGSIHEDKPNAIALGSGPLPQLLTACAAEGEPNAGVPASAEVGRAPVTPANLAESLADLQRIPPKAFNVARVERVFNSKLQYVELEVSGYRLSSRKVHIPNDLLIGEDKALEKRLRNTFTLLEGKESLKVAVPLLDQKKLEPECDEQGQPKTVVYSEQQLEVDRKQIYEDFLTSVPGYGWLVRRWDRPAFDQRIAWFRKRVEAFRDGVEARLGEAVLDSINDLASTLLPKLRERLPRRLIKTSLDREAPTEATLLSLVKQELEAAFRQGGRFFNPVVQVQFKDLTYETIKDIKFQQMLDRAFGQTGDESATARMFEEFDAAREAQDPQ